MWLTFLILSFGVALVPVVAMIFDSVHSIKKIKIKPLTALSVGVLISAMLMFFPMHLSDTSIDSMRGLRAFFLSVFNSMQLFTAGCEFEVVEQGLTNCPDWLDSICQVWSSILFVAAPVLTFGFVLSLFKKLSANIKYIFSFFGSVYVFSELNDKSLILANDIKKTNKKAVIVFTDVFEENEETSYELIEKAKKIRAICFKSDILVVEFKNHSKNKPIYFFAIGEDETENLNQSLKLIEKYKNRENTRIYVFSTKIESGILLSSTDKGKMRVRRINEVQSLINHLLYKKGKRIFKTAKENSDGTKDISIVIIGMGRHGTEMVKALSWYGQMDGYNLEINAFDKDPLAEEKFTALAPELMSPAYNGTHIHGEAQYKITIHPNSDVETITFVNEIKKISNATYVLVALGDDDVNIRTAINLRMHFERMKISPVIQAIVYNSQQKKALDGIKNFAGQDYNIEFIGDLESSYVEKVIIDSDLEKEALDHHQSYVAGLLEKEDSFERVLTRYLTESGMSKEEFKKLCEINAKKEAKNNEKKEKREKKEAEKKEKAELKEKEKKEKRELKEKEKKAKKDKKKAKKDKRKAKKEAKKAAKESKKPKKASNQSEPSEKELISQALKNHETEKFWKYEYNYRSSIATAAHRQAKIACGLVYDDNKPHILTPEEEEAIQILENRRWNAYTRAEGYIYSGSRDEKSRNDLGKMHQSLVEHDRLTEAEKKRNSEVATKIYYYKEK